MTSPRRVACLSAESADLCAALGAWDRVVAVTAFFDQSQLPPRPVVSGFSTVAMKRIEEVHPDLILTFSDVQADLTSDLIRAGYPVIATNQRTLAEIADTILLISRVLGLETQGIALQERFLRAVAPQSPIGKRVYFEEWNEPLISGITWVGELIERAGGVDVFAHLRSGRKSSERTVTSEQVIAAAPELMLASWCGEPLDMESVCARPGWAAIPAIAQRQIYEIPGADILQPGLGLIRGFHAIRQRILEAGSST